MDPAPLTDLLPLVALAAFLAAALAGGIALWARTLTVGALADADRNR